MEVFGAIVSGLMVLVLIVLFLLIVKVMVRNSHYEKMLGSIPLNKRDLVLVTIKLNKITRRYTVETIEGEVQYMSKALGKKLKTDFFITPEGMEFLTGLAIGSYLHKFKSLRSVDKRMLKFYHEHKEYADLGLWGYRNYSEVFFHRQHGK